MSKAHKHEIEGNRSALQSIIDTVQLCDVQNIAFCGHRDVGTVDPTGNTPLTNDGNFRALLCLRLHGGDEALQKQLKHAPKNAQYTSKTIQNEFLTDMRYVGHGSE